MVEFIKQRIDTVKSKPIVAEMTSPKGILVHFVPNDLDYFTLLSDKNTEYYFANRNKLNFSVYISHFFEITKVSPPKIEQAVPILSAFFASPYPGSREN